MVAGRKVSPRGGWVDLSSYRQNGRKVCVSSGTIPGPSRTNLYNESFDVCDRKKKKFGTEDQSVKGDLLYKDPRKGR